ncbi:MAG TPA: hypothetical protein PLV68_10945, partial [Ilumatobacteraceae bacterium]|nr:hypothetical protein [Ilumatobacteraceae bacterium]
NLFRLQRLAPGTQEVTQFTSTVRHQRASGESGGATCRDSPTAPPLNGATNQVVMVPGVSR